MKTTNSLDREIKKQVALADKLRERKTKMLEALRAANKAESEKLTKLGVGKATRVSTSAADKLPRGVVTKAIFEALKDNKAGLPINKIIQKVKDTNKHLSSVDGIDHKIRNTINASAHTGNHFRRVKRGVYATKGKLDNALFDRLAKETAALAEPVAA